MTYIEFMLAFYTGLREAMLKEDQRPGQFFFNLLYEHRPDIADEWLVGSHFDPFYNDALLSAAITEVQRVWQMGAAAGPPEVEPAHLQALANAIVYDLDTANTSMKIAATKELRTRCANLGYKTPGLKESKDAIDGALS